VTSKGCYQGRVLMLKAKIGPKTTKSNRGKVLVKASGQPESETQKKF